MFIIAFPSFTPFPQFSGINDPIPLAHLLVSSTVRLIWNITQNEDISLVHTWNRDCVNIKPATWHQSEASLDYTSIVELTLLLLFFSCLTRGIEWPDPVHMRTRNAETAYWHSARRLQYDVARSMLPSPSLWYLFKTLLVWFDTKHQLLKLETSLFSCCYTS